MSRPAAVALTLLLALPPGARADERDRAHVGVQPGGRIVVPTNQILQPAGRQATFFGRPVDLLLTDGGGAVVAKNMRDLLFLDPADGTLRQTLALPAPKQGRAAGFSAVGLVAAGDRVFASDSQSAVRVARRQPDGSFAWDGEFTLKRPAV